MRCLRAPTVLWPRWWLQKLWWKIYLQVFKRAKLRRKILNLIAYLSLYFRLEETLWFIRRARYWPTRRWACRLRCSQHIKWATIIRRVKACPCTTPSRLGNRMKTPYPTFCSKKTPLSQRCSNLKTWRVRLSCSTSTIVLATSRLLVRRVSMSLWSMVLSTISNHHLMSARTRLKWRKSTYRPSMWRRALRAPMSLQTWQAWMFRWSRSRRKELLMRQPQYKTPPSLQIRRLR